MMAGHALNYLISQEGYSRSNFLLSSKAGYVRDNFPSTVASTEVVNDHCVHPHFLKAELEISLKHFGVETLDVYYLNNFAESQMYKFYNLGNPSMANYFMKGCRAHSNFYKR